METICVLNHANYNRVYLINPNGLASSRQREFRPKPLTEPYVIVSHHTALVIQKYIIN